MLLEIPLRELCFARDHRKQATDCHLITQLVSIEHVPTRRTGEGERGLGGLEKGNGIILLHQLSALNTQLHHQVGVVAHRLLGHQDRS